MPPARPRSFDPDTPHPARIQDYWLGGIDWYQADKDRADEFAKIYPRARQMTMNSQLFAGRAITWAAQRAGIRSFIDLGSGVASGDSAHRLARAAVTGARVAYVDYDPDINRRTRRILRHAGEPDGIAVIDGDVREAGLVLDEIARSGVIDLGQPAMALLTLMLSTLPASQARALVGAYAGRLAPGSVIAVSVARNDDPDTLRHARELWPAPLHNHTYDDIVSFFTSLHLVTPGVVLARGWRAEMPEANLPPTWPMYVLAAIGRKH